MFLCRAYLCKPVKNCKNNCLIMTEIHSRSQPLILDHKKKVELILPLNLHMAICHFFTRVSVCIFLWPIRRVDPVNTVRIKKMVARSTHSAWIAPLEKTKVHDSVADGHCVLHMHHGKSLDACILLLHCVYGAQGGVNALSYFYLFRVISLMLIIFVRSG